MQRTATFLLVLLAIANAFGQLKTTHVPAVLEGKVAPHGGRPTILINNQPHAPMLYALTHVYGGRWSWEEAPARNLKNFADIGFRLFQVDLYLEDIWYKDAPGLDIAKAQRQVRGVLDARPDAAVFIRLHVNAPFWWNDAHPEECTQYADGPVDKRTYGPPFNLEDGDVDRPLRASLASAKWRAAATEKLVEFCRAMSATPEGNAVVGLHIAGGIYGEWHYWGFIGHDPDTGPAMTAHFRNWLKAKYGTDAKLRAAWKTDRYTLTNATVPDTTERKHTSDGIFRDASRERRVIDYFTCQQEAVADDIVHFSEVAKKSWPRPLIVGVFYGYYHLTFSRQASGGHLDMDKVLNCPYIDYLSAPQSYYGPSRKLGGAGHSRGIVESARLHGKLWLDEMDNGEFDQAHDGIRIRREANPDYVPVLRRSALHPLSRGIGLWYYDFGPRRTTGWWDVPEYLENIRQEKAFFDQYLDRPYQSEADVLMVYDMESFYHVRNGWTPVSEDVVDKLVAEAYHAGFVFDNVFLSDLDRVNLDQYKVVVFTNTYHLTDADKELVRRKVARNGRHLVWNYMPGYTDGRGLDVKHVSSITGMSLQRIDFGGKPTVNVSGAGMPEVSYSFNGPVSPLLAVADPKAVPLGRLAGTDHVVLARKAGKGYTSWYGTLPLHTPELMRSVMQAAGVHIYNEHTSDVTFSGSGLLWIHSVDGGSRTVRLRNGKTLQLDLPPKSTTLYNNQTGEKLL
jgi:hypothetical protein